MTVLECLGVQVEAASLAHRLGFGEKLGSTDPEGIVSYDVRALCARCLIAGQIARNSAFHRLAEANNKRI